MNEMTLSSRHRIRNIRILVVRGRARYLSVTEAPPILSFTRGWERDIFCFFQPAGTGNRAPNSSVKGPGTEPRTLA